MTVEHCCTVNATVNLKKKLDSSWLTSCGDESEKNDLCLLLNQLTVLLIWKQEKLAATRLYLELNAIVCMLMSALWMFLYCFLSWPSSFRVLACYHSLISSKHSTVWGWWEGQRQQQVLFMNQNNRRDNIRQDRSLLMLLGWFPQGHYGLTWWRHYMIRGSPVNAVSPDGDTNTKIMTRHHY